ncbi:MAG: exosome complex exonuclease Rrp41 [Candidatus Altiarchaeota archaeon]|nr:exosome complex exonuclease Rrp41 [Candidatus Altiarchaeota archaeon]
MAGKDMKLIVDGKRLDGRNFDELRDIKMEVNVLERTVGSAYVQWGNNKVLAGVHGPREFHPKFLRDPTKAILTCTYNMAAFSVEDRKRPGPDRRSVEISKVVSDALSSVTVLERYPDTGIDVFVEVLQADAGTRCVAIVAASLALANSGVPMKDLVSACASGKIDGEIVVDLMKEEDNYGECDLPVAISPRRGDVLLLQMDGNLSRDEYNKAYEMAVDGAKKVYEMQKKTLLDSMVNFVEGERK